jgi:hypothetical protein
VLVRTPVRNASRSDAGVAVSRTIISLRRVHSSKRNHHDVAAYRDCASPATGLQTFSRRNKNSSLSITRSNRLQTSDIILMITRIIIAAAVALSFTPTMSVFAQEHPEHPKKAGEEKEVTKAEISTGIKNHIRAESKKSSDQKFHTNYEGKDLALDLIKVHDDRLSSLGEGKYFACVDMKATDGTVYDIDFFMSGEPGDLKATETSVHKVNGKPLYNWKEEGGVWKKVSG